MDYDDTTHYYYVRYTMGSGGGSPDGAIEIGHKNGGSDDILASAVGIVIDPGAWYYTKICVNEEGDISVILRDGGTFALISGFDARETDITDGRVGLAASFDASAVFDDWVFEKAYNSVNAPECPGCEERRIVIWICNEDKLSDEVHDFYLNGHLMPRPNIDEPAEGGDPKCGGGIYTVLPLSVLTRLEYCMLRTDNAGLYPGASCYLDASPYTTGFVCCGAQVGGLCHGTTYPGTTDCINGDIYPDDIYRKSVV